MGERCDFELGIHFFGNAILSEAKRKYLSNQTMTAEDLKRYIDAFSKALNDELKQRKAKDDELAEAMQQAESASEDAEIETTHEDRTTFEELDQPREEGPDLAADAG
jgi:hypothetical protein